MYHEVIRDILSVDLLTSQYRSLEPVMEAREASPARLRISSSVTSKMRSVPTSFARLRSLQLPHPSIDAHTRHGRLRQGSLRWAKASCGASQRRRWYVCFCSPANATATIVLELTRAIRVARGISRFIRRRMNSVSQTLTAIRLRRLRRRA